MESQKHIKKYNESTNSDINSSLLDISIDCKPEPRVRLVKDDNGKKSRNWITTVNNPNPNARAQFDLVLNDERIVFAKGQEEIGESGTVHLQMYTNWRQPISLSAIRKIWPSGHHEICVNRDKAILYCCKSETRSKGPWTHGVDPVTRHPNGKKTVKELMLYSEDELLGLGPNAYLSAKKAISIAPRPEYVHDNVRGVWIYGAPGTGKSRYCFEKYPGAFRKSQNKWWDGYTGQSTVILDDLDRYGGQTLGHYLKIWTDRYPCTGEVKGFTVQLCHTAFVVTSNYSIEELFPDDVQLQKVIRRRCRVIKFVVPGRSGHEKPHVLGELVITYEGLTASDGTKGIMGGGERSQPEGVQLGLDGLRDQLNEPGVPRIPAVLNDEFDEFLAMVADEKARELADAFLNSDM